MALFDVAQRIEVILGQWQWADADFPRSAEAFVKGWHVSGDETDLAIRRAALQLCDDPSSDGPRLKGAYGDSLIDVDEIADF